MPHEALANSRVPQKVTSLTKKKFSLKEQFKGATSGFQIPDTAMISGYAERCDYVPDVDPHFVFAQSVLRDLCNWWESGGHDGWLGFGPQGSGKTQSIIQFCARLNIPVYGKTAFRRMRFEQLVYSDRIIAGNTIPLYGQLAKAMGAEDLPGVFLLNEADHADDGVLTGMYDVVEGQPLDMGGIEVLVPKPGFRVAIAQNTRGLTGNTSGVHPGARRQNAAFVDRFWTIEFGYMDEDLERKVLADKVPKLDGVIRDKMIDVANTVRDAHLGRSDEHGWLEYVISTRSLIRWATIASLNRAVEKDGISAVQYALDRCGLNAASPETRSAIHKIAHAEFDFPDPPKPASKKQAAP